MTTIPETEPKSLAFYPPHRLFTATSSQIITTTHMHTLDLSQYGITGTSILHHLSTAALYEEAIRYDQGTCVSSNGALVAYSGSKTGRSPKDKRIVKQKPSEDDVWWGPGELSFG
jgi:ATP-dependent phosphoenolpyruvate carboxykinase